MAQTASEVFVALTGGVYVDLEASPLTLPSSATATLTSWTELGYLDESGIVQSRGKDTTPLRAWQNGDTLRVLQTGDTVTYALTLMQTNNDVIEVLYGNRPNSGAWELTGDPLPVTRWVFDVFDGDEKIRVCIPHGQVTEVGDENFVNSDAKSHPITITAYPDSNGVKAYFYKSPVVGS